MELIPRRRLATLGSVLARCLLTLALAACYAPTVQEGLPCGAGSACPAGLACSPGGRCELPGDTDAAVDVPVDTDTGDADADADGVADLVDNCPMTSNASQADEDADGVGNPCDSCPHVANADQTADADADGVGDACDPRPGQADEIVHFEGFDDGLPPSWSTNGGAWSVSGGVLTGAASTTGSIGLATYDVALPSRLAVATHVAVTAGTGSAPNAGVLTHAAGTDFYRCGVVTSPRVEVARHNGTAQTILMQTNLPSGAWTDVDLLLIDDGGMLSCTAARGGVSHQVMGTDATLSGDRVGFRVREATVTFRYVVVFELK